jgi:DNA mismatch endonuclease (patch repair protein)
MADVVNSLIRSKNMAAIRGKHTRPELALRRALHASGLRFRLHDQRLPGKPDIVFPRHRAIVEVRGCFWHRHENCRFSTNPDQNQEFWQAKFARTVVRDNDNILALRGMGWRVAIIWECALRNNKAPNVAALVSCWLYSDSMSLEIGE